MNEIGNPFQGHQIGWTWEQHIAAGYEGGTDHIFYPTDGPITAAADGTVRLAPGQNGFTPGDAIILTLTDGRTINYREVASHTGKFPRTVKREDEIGEATEGGRWPHIDATVNGKRVPFEPLVTIGTDPAGGVTPIEGEGMKIIYCASPQTWDAVGEHTHQALSSTVANTEALIWGNAITVTTAQRTQLLADCDARATTFYAGMPATTTGGMTLAQYTATLPGFAVAADIPTTGQLGEALTSTVSLVDAHTDEALAGLTLKTS